ncbi:Ig-like domain-containing protein, partial [Halomonas sp. C05BenzN]|uniref:Ig-like domain-containing protein n=1 Tax=Halomonas sp. C05BenzN TaxID=3411041 RepID=UPI003B959A4E
MASRHAIRSPFTALLITMVGAMASGHAVADLVEFSFMNPSGEQRTLPADAHYANPVGSIDFMVSGGVDRRVSVSILRQDGSVIQTETSHLLGADDRIATSSGEYYGAKLALRAPGEGGYQIRSRILSSSGDVVSERVAPLLVDTTPPTVGNFSMNGAGVSKAPDGRYIFSHHDPRYIALDNVADTGSNIDKIRFETYRASGDLVREGEVPYYSGENKAQLGTGGNNSVTSAHVPNGLRESNRIRYIVRDRAGNSAHKDLMFYNSSSCGPSPEPVAYYDPGYNGSYMGLSKFHRLRPVEASGNHVATNPVKILYRVPRTAYRGLPEGEIYGGTPAGISSSLDHTDGTYAYFSVEGPLGTDGNILWTQVGWTTPATWRCAPLGLPNPTFASNAKPPQATNLEAYINGVGWVGSRYSANRDTPKAPRDTAITKFRYTVEPRPYRQVAELQGATCTVPAGSSSCTGNLNLSFNATGTAAHYHYRPVVKREDKGSLYTRYNTFVWEWDAADPSVTKLISLDKERKRIVFEGHKPLSGRTWNRVRMAQAGIVAIDSQGSRHTIDATAIETNGDYSVVTVDYGSLPEGTYDLAGWIEDFNRNRDEKTLGSIYNDTTPPTISINSSQGNQVSTLDSLTFQLSDDTTTDPKVHSVSLSGGPATDFVQMSSRGIAVNQYALEYPIIFPSLQAGEEYTLTVVAKDAQYNQSTEDFVFTYDPPRVSLQGGVDGKLMIPAVQHEFKHLDGRRIIETQPLTLADGSTVAGTYDVFAS